MLFDYYYEERYERSGLAFLDVTFLKYYQKWLFPAISYLRFNTILWVECVECIIEKYKENNIYV